MPTNTTNYALQKPVVGADSNAWGGFLNSNFDSLDGMLFKLFSNARGATRPTEVKTGGLWTASATNITYAFDGTDDIPLFSYNAGTNKGSWVADINNNTVTTNATGELTVANNVLLNDGIRFRIGTANLSRLYSTGSGLIFEDAAANTTAFKTGAFKVQNAAGTEDMIEAVADSFVKLRYNNTARLTTTNTGVDISGQCVADTFGGTGVSTDIAADAASTVKVPHVKAVADFFNAREGTLGPTAVGSGNFIDFTAIPSGVNYIDILFSGVGFISTTDLLVQVRLAGGAVVSGYLSSGSTAASGVTLTATNGFVVYLGTGAGPTTRLHGVMSLIREPGGSATWLCTHNCYRENAGTSSMGGGRVAAGGTVTGIRITSTTGGIALAAGFVTVRWRV